MKQDIYINKRILKFMSISNWESSKLKSNYHFDKWHQDTDKIMPLGHFRGDWQEQIQRVIDQARPLNWANRREYTGRPGGNVDAEEHDLIAAGAGSGITAGTAAVLCNSSTNNGKSDWYLPALDELIKIFQTNFN